MFAPIVIQKGCPPRTTKESGIGQCAMCERVNLFMRHWIDRHVQWQSENLSLIVHNTALSKKFHASHSIFQIRRNACEIQNFRHTSQIRS